MIPSTKQDDRECMDCGRRLLSGVAHIDRGYLIAMVCHTCAAKPDFSFEWLKHLSRRKADANQKAWEAKKNA